MQVEFECQACTSSGPETESKSLGALPQKRRGHGQKEEWRGWQADIQPNNDENGHHAISLQQDEDTKQENANEQGEITNKEQMQRIVDEDPTWTTNEEL